MMLALQQLEFKRKNRQKYFWVHRELNPRPSDHQARELFRGSVVFRGSLTEFQRGKNIQERRRKKREKTSTKENNRFRHDLYFCRACSETLSCFTFSEVSVARLCCTRLNSACRKIVLFPCRAHTVIHQTSSFLLLFYSVPISTSPADVARELTANLSSCHRGYTRRGKHIVIIAERLSRLFACFSNSF